MGPYNRNRCKEDLLFRKIIPMKLFRKPHEESQATKSQNKLVYNISTMATAVVLFEIAMLACNKKITQWLMRRRFIRSRSHIIGISMAHDFFAFVKRLSVASGSLLKNSETSR